MQLKPLQILQRKFLSNSGWTKILMFLCCLFFSSQYVFSQHQMKFHPGETISCPLGEGIGQSRFGIEEAKKQVAAFRAAKKYGTKSNSINQSPEFIITYGDGFENNQEAMDAFQFAADIWASLLNSSVPIRVSVSFVEGTSGAANASVGYFISDFPNTPIQGFSYPAAVANSIAGQVLREDLDYELTIRINPAINYYYGIDGNPPSNQADFVTFMLHELTHGLGFIGAGDIFSSYVFNDQGERLLNNSSIFREGEEAFLDAPNAVIGDEDGDFPKLSRISNTDFINGISHVNPQEYPEGSINALMTPVISSGEVIFDPGPIVKGLFTDLGWRFNDQNPFPLVMNQLRFSEEYDKGTSDTQNTVLTNITDQEITINLGITETLEEGITLNQPLTFILLPGESINLQATLDTSLLDKGIYDGSIMISVPELNIEYRLPVVFKVLDGTPILQIAKDSLVFTLPQNSIIKDSLIIANLGDGLLEYEVSVENGSDNFITIEETNGSLAKEESAAIPISFDTNGLDLQGYTSLIKLTTNDSDNAVIDIPVIVEIITAPSISVLPEALDVVFESFLLARDTLQLKNSGDFPLEYSIAFTDTLSVDFPLSLRNPIETMDDRMQSFTQILIFGLGDDSILDNDTYISELFVENNDPTNPSVKVPLTIHLPNKRGVYELLGTDTFGDVLVGDTVTKDFVFRNIGLGPINFDNLGPFFVINNPEGFTVLDWRTENNDKGPILPGESFTIIIQFAPTTEGETSRAMVARGNDNFAANSLSSFRIKGNAVTTPIIEVSKDSINSRIEIMSGITTTSEIFEINNTGNRELNYRIDLNDANETISFSDQEGTILAGETKEITITFDAGSLESGTYTSSFTISPVGSVTSTLLNPVFISTALEVFRPEIGDFGNTPNSWNYGVGEVGNPSIVEFLLENSGNAPITLASMASNNPEFEIVFYDQDTFEEVTFEEVEKVIQPGDAWFYDVIYLRNQVGEANGTITVESDALQSVFEIDLTGKAEAPPIGEFEDIDFVVNVPSTNVGNKSDTGLFLSNIGNAPIQVDSLRINNPEFEVLFFDESGELITFEEWDKTIAADSSIGPIVIYEPTQTGESMGNITFFSDALQNEYTVRVASSATEPVLGGVFDDVRFRFQGGSLETGTTIDFGKEDFETSSVVNVILRNAGDVKIVINEIKFEDSPNIEILYENGNAEFVEVFEDFKNVIYPGERTRLRLIYPRTITGDFSGKCFIKSDAEQELLTLDLSGGAIPPPAEITSFSLVRPFTGEVIQEIQDGDTVDLIGLIGASIVANIGDTVPGSVVFDYDTDVAIQTDNEAPYAIAGDRNGRINPFLISLGAHTLTATPYTETDGGGEAEIAKTISFTAINSSLPSIDEFILINADTDEEIGMIRTGDTVDVSGYANNAFNIIAKPSDDSVRLVRFGFNGEGNFNIDFRAPFELEDNRDGISFTNGKQTLTATPFAFRSGNPATITFEVIGAEGANKTPGSVSTETFKVYPNPVDGMAKFTLGTTNAETLQGRLVNILGQELDITNRLSIDTQGNGQLDMQNIPAGHYYLKLSDLQTGVSYETKIVKM